MWSQYYNALALKVTRNNYHSTAFPLKKSPQSLVNQRQLHTHFLWPHNCGATEQQELSISTHVLKFSGLGTSFPTSTGKFHCEIQFLSNL